MTQWYLLIAGLAGLALCLWSAAGRSRAARWWVDMESAYGRGEDLVLTCLPGLALFCVLPATARLPDPLGPLLGLICLLAAVVLFLSGLVRARWKMPVWYRRHRAYRKAVEQGWTPGVDPRPRRRAPTERHGAGRHAR